MGKEWGGGVKVEQEWCSPVPPVLCVQKSHLCPKSGRDRKGPVVCSRNQVVGRVVLEKGRTGVGHGGSHL